MSPKSIFQKLINEDKLFQSYLFFGKPELDFVRQLGNYLENQDWSTPSVFLIDYMEAGSGIGDMRAIQNFLWQAPVKSKRRLAVISQAEKLTVAAQNAVLKIAEEPPARGLVILLARDSELLTPALASRLQKIYFSPSGELKKNEIAVKFLSVSARERSFMIRELASEGSQLEKLVEGIMTELKKDPVRNLKSLKDLCYRWSLINRFNTNKRLQLEAWLKSLGR